MRFATILMCIGLAAASSGCMVSDGDAPKPQAASAPAAAPAPSVSPSPPAPRSAATPGGARGGAATAAARGTGEPVEVPPDPLTQARTDCWMKVEGQKALRGIDQRIAFIDKCVADQMKSKP